MLAFLQDNEVSKFQMHGVNFTNTLQQELYHAQTGQPRSSTIHTYQIDAVIATKNFFDINRINGNHNPGPALIHMPTGAGKSGIVFMLPYVLQCRKVIVLSPSKTITTQLGEAFGAFTTVPSFMETYGNATGPELEAFLEHVTFISSTSQVTTHQMSNVVIVNAQKFGGRSMASLVHEDKEIVSNVKEFFNQFCTIIVDEAHYWPSATWKAIVQNFQRPGKRIVFLTATPTRNGNPILPIQQVVFKLEKNTIEGRTIRHSTFKEFSSIDILVPDNFANYPPFVHRLCEEIENVLNTHDQQEPLVRHRAIILVRLADDARSLAQQLNNFKKMENFALPIVAGTTQDDIAQLRVGVPRVGIVCKMLLEGYDNNKISVCVIIRNVNPNSKVLFNQFVGRSVRMSRFDDGHLDTVIAQVISFQRYGQRRLWDAMEEIAEEDPADDEE